MPTHVGRLARGRRPVAWPSANGPKVDDFSVVNCGDRGHGDGILVDIPPHIECARVRHGWPPSSCVLVPGALHEAALACGQLTRGVNRRSADPSEVMMYRRAPFLWRGGVKP